MSYFAQCPDGHRLRLFKRRYANANRAWSKGMNASSDWPRNRLLLALPSRNLKRLTPELENISCHRAQVLMDADSALDHVFFPDSGVVSVVAVYADGSIIEMATIGREGCTAVQAVFGANVPPSGFSSRSPGAQQRCRARRSHGPWSRCRPSEVSCTLTSKPFSSRSWCR